MEDYSNGDPPSPSPSDDRPTTGPDSVATSMTNGTSHSTGPALNPRSCVTCRKRKVKCNKQYPCSNCSKAHIDCIFPAPGRAPRRPRKPPDGELLARLRRLEGVVQSLGVQVDDDSPIPSIPVNGQGGGYIQGDSMNEQKRLPAIDPKLEQGRDSLVNSFGRLVVSESGKSRYVNNRFWAAVSSEVEDLKSILDESSEEERDTPSPVMHDAHSTPTQHGFIFNTTSSAHDLHSLNPTPDLIQTYWKIFVEHCDPFMKIIHVPTMEEQVHAAMVNPGKASKAVEVMLFAIYFAAVTCLTSDECLAMTNESQDTLAKRYRYGLEQALVRAHFLFTEEIVVLQGFIIFLICLRRYEDSRVIWSLCGLACRMAITLGLHRDGSSFDISPLDVEVRRRTWWQILILDIRSSEELGCDPVVLNHEFDTKFPLNVEDEDLHASMTEPPPERIGFTRNSFCLIRYNSAKCYAKLFTRPRSLSSPIGSCPEPTLQDRERWVKECEEHLEETFFRHANLQNLMQWAICTVSRLILAKQFILVYGQFQPISTRLTLAPEVQERLFITSITSLENAIDLEALRKTVKWGWLFKKYSQFHATAYLFSELTRRTRGPLIERAWRAIDRTHTEFWEKDPEHLRGPMWKPLMRTEAIARRARERDLEVQRQEDAQMAIKREADVNTPPQHAATREAGASLSPPVSVSNFKLQQPNGATSRIPTNASMHQNMGVPNSFGQQSLPVVKHALLNHTNNNYYGATINGHMNVMQPQASYPPFVPEASQWHNVPAAGVPLIPNERNGNDPTGEWFTDPNFAAPLNMNDGSDIFASGDPMVSGSDGPEMQWAEWNEMMREFELERGQSGATGQWQRRPVGEAWLG